MRRLPLLVVVLVGCRSSQGEPEVKPLVTVRVARAALADVDLALTVPATIFARERASISSSLTAPIRVLRAHKGDRVERGQVLAVLEDRDLLAQRGEAAATVRQAQVLRERRAQLFQQGAIPQRDLLGIETELAQARARLERIDAQIRFSELRSPFAGTIVEQFLYAGDMVKPDSPVFTVVDMAVAVARAQVPETEVAALHRGQQATFRSEALGDLAMAGKITMINQSVDQARRTVEAWAEIPNGAGQLRDGVFGHLTIVTERRPQRVVVPRAALQLETGASKGTVMVVDDHQIAHRREVEILGAPGDRVPIASGLRAGETVVIEAGYGLPDNTPVRLEQGPPRGSP
jgi:RND family efflux transporter MFP subunit